MPTLPHAITSHTFHSPARSGSSGDVMPSLVVNCGPPGCQRMHVSPGLSPRYGTPDSFSKTTLRPSMSTIVSATAHHWPTPRSMMLHSTERIHAPLPAPCSPTHQ